MYSQACLAEDLREEDLVALAKLALEEALAGLAACMSHPLREDPAAAGDVLINLGSGLDFEVM